MFDCRICGSRLKNYNLKSIRCHFYTDKCIKITNDLLRWKNSVHQDIENGDESMDTLKRHHDMNVLWNVYNDFI